MTISHRALSVLLLLLTLTSLVGAQSRDETSNWRLVYANDEKGQKVGGDINELIRSVRDGEPIRIGWTIESLTDRNLKVEHFANATFVTILANHVVFAQIDPIVGQTPSVKDQFIALKENVEWSFLASSLGANDSMNRNVVTGEIIDHQKFACGIKWFVERR
jgi:hypothetical protein